VWNFSLRNATFKMDDKRIVTAARIKIIACKDGDAIDSVAGTPQSSPMKPSPMKSSSLKRY
jgi:transcription initiation factor TFIIA small subunit